MTTNVKDEATESIDEPEKSFFARGALLGLVGGVVVAVLLISVGGLVVSLVDDLFGSDEVETVAADDGIGGDEALISQGKNLTVTCIGCHSTDGVDGVGPSWQGLDGSDRPLDGGATVVADAAYIRNSITNPNDQVVVGFAPGLMPGTYGETFSADELDALIAYLQSL